METLQVAVCEDIPEERNKLLSLIEQSGVSAHCTVFPSGEEFLADYQAGKYDLIFMDIYMDGITGVETVAAIRRVDENVPVAFATTSTEHTLESYRLDVLKYIEKPVKEKAVRELLQFARMKKGSKPRLVLRVGGKEVGIPFERILYAEQQLHNLILYLTGGETVHATERLDLIEPRFHGQNFFRCHKSYLVNLSYIESLDRELMVFHMKDGENVHINRQSLCAARNAYEAYLFSKAREIGDE